MAIKKLRTSFILVSTGSINSRNNLAEMKKKRKMNEKKRKRNIQFRMVWRQREVHSLKIQITLNHFDIGDTNNDTFFGTKNGFGEK